MIALAVEKALQEPVSRATTQAQNRDGCRPRGGLLQAAIPGSCQAVIGHCTRPRGGLLQWSIQAVSRRHPACPGSFYVVTGPFSSASLVRSTISLPSASVMPKCGVKRSEFVPPWMTPRPFRRRYSSVLFAP